VGRSEVRFRVAAELSDARASRSRGNEGRARVCARRAAGAAIRAAMAGRASGPPPSNAYTVLRWYASLADQPPELRAAAARLAARVTPEHVLPHREDPLEDARVIIAALLGDEAS
jgi:hypothetical protein